MALACRKQAKCQPAGTVPIYWQRIIGSFPSARPEIRITSPQAIVVVPVTLSSNFSLIWNGSCVNRAHSPGKWMMLRITTYDGPESVTFKVEGRLVGPWVSELERCWKSALAGSQCLPVRVDLAAATYIDAGGRELLKQMHRQGVELQATDCLMKSIVDDILKEPRE